MITSVNDALDIFRRELRSYKVWVKAMQWSYNFSVPASQWAEFFDSTDLSKFQRYKHRLDTMIEILGLTPAQVEKHCQSVEVPFVEIEFICSLTRAAAPTA